MWQFFKLHHYPLPHGSARAAHGFAGFCDFIHIFTPGHPLRGGLLSPLVHSPGKKSQGMTNLSVCSFGTGCPLDPKELLARKDEPIGLFLSLNPGFCCSQRPTESIRKCLLAIQSRTVRPKCKLQAQPNSCLPAVSTLNLNICAMNVWLWPWRVQPQPHSCSFHAQIHSHWPFQAESFLFTFPRGKVPASNLKSSGWQVQVWPKPPPRLALCKGLEFKNISPLPIALILSPPGWRSLLSRLEQQSPKGIWENC